MADLSKEIAIKALKKFDALLKARGLVKVRLIVGGGGSMVLAHNFPGMTEDVDSMLTIDFSEISNEVLQVAKVMGLQGDWLNPYYSAFAHYLPSDYDSRLIHILSGSAIAVDGIGVEDLLIMKLMAGRGKDMKHIRYLLRKNPDLKIIDKRLEELRSIAPNEAPAALDLFDDLKEEMELE